MGLYRNSVDAEDVARQPATIYGPLPSHNRTKIATVLHTTETRGVPSFNEGDTAPHYTYEPFNGHRFIKFAEPSDGYVGTMKGHTTGGHSNCKAIQLEIVAYTSRTAAQSVDRDDMWVGHFTDEMYQHIADFYAWTMKHYGVEWAVTTTPPGGWKAGVESSWRFTDAAWEVFSGLTAHGAVPLNTHWDTGELDLARIYELAAPNTYRDVINVPETDWAQDVIDTNIDLGIIVTGDDFVDDWLRDQMTDGRFWTFMHRLVAALDKRYQPKG